MANDRITIPLPEGFEKIENLKGKLQALVNKKYGDGWEVESINPQEGKAFASRPSTLTEITKSKDRDEFEIRVTKSVKPADGARFAARQEDQNPGYTLTRFDPFLHRATLSRLSKGEKRCRQAVADVLGAKPWDVQVKGRPDGGFDLEVPRYVPSKHDDKMEEIAAATIGEPGWAVETDPRELTVSMIPGTPPTFPAVYPFPFWDKKKPAVRRNDWAFVDLGKLLGPRGGEEGRVLSTDFVSNPHMQISGITGGGKGVTLTNLISGCLAKGWQFVLVDAVKGGVDFESLKPYIRDGGWGADLRSGCAVVAMAYAEGQRRKALIKHHKVQKWTQLPESENISPLLVVTDELTSLLAQELVPKGVKKDSAVAMEANENNLLKATILSTIGKIARELRFVGVSLAVSTQVASSTVGIPTELRSNLGAKVLLGANPNDNNRRLALNAPDMVPKVPKNIIDNEEASQGVGVYEFDGVGTGVWKGFFSPPGEMAAWLESLRVPKGRAPEPTPGQIARFTPSLDDEGPSAVPQPSPEIVAKDNWDRDPETGEKLSGFERANAARHAVSQGAK